jgi:hypothetical protein
VIFVLFMKQNGRKNELLISRIEGFMDITNRYIAYCGNDCTQCPQFKCDCLDGCLGTSCANYCGTCVVRLCNREYNTANCAQCEEYPCKKLGKQYENMEKDGYAEWAIAARKVMEEIRKA